MNDRMQTSILQLAGRCPHCGRARCGQVDCFRLELAAREAAPVLSRQAADRLIRGLVRAGMSRGRALEQVHRTFTVIAA